MDRSIKINDTRMEVYSRDFYRCQYKDCGVRGWDNIQMAHRLSRSKKNENYIRQFWRDWFGMDISKSLAQNILNHPLNLITSCPKHNQLFLIDNKPIETDELLMKIREEGNYEVVRERLQKRLSVEYCDFAEWQ